MLGRITSLKKKIAQKLKKGFKMRFIIISLIFYITSFSTAYGKPIDDNKSVEVKITEQLERINKKAKKAEDNTKQMLVLVRKLLNKKKVEKNNEQN